MIVASSLLSPEGWRGTAVRLLDLSWALILVGVAHLCRTFLADYASGYTAWRKAMEGNIAAAIAYLALCLLTGLLWLGMTSISRAEVVHDRAQLIAPLIDQEIKAHYPDLPRYSYVGSLIEKETCPSMSHRYCWSTTAQLKTPREEGAGLGQLTRTWTKDGSVRFDALQELKAANPKALEELSWETVYVRADLGVRAILLKTKDCINTFKRSGSRVKDPLVLLAFCDAAYNGGYGGMQSDRKLCNLTSGCDPNQWFGHVELHSNKNREKWQGYGDSAFDINRKHVRETVPFESRRQKYVLLLGV